MLLNWRQFYEIPTKFAPHKTVMVSREIGCCFWFVLTGWKQYEGRCHAPLIELLHHVRMFLEKFSARMSALSCQECKGSLKFWRISVYPHWKIKLQSVDKLAHKSYKCGSLLTVHYVFIGFSWLFLMTHSF